MNYSSCTHARLKFFGQLYLPYLGESDGSIISGQGLEPGEDSGVYRGDGEGEFNEAEPASGDESGEDEEAEPASGEDDDYDEAEQVGAKSNAVESEVEGDHGENPASGAVENNSDEAPTGDDSDPAALNINWANSNDFKKAMCSPGQSVLLFRSVINELTRMAHHPVTFTEGSGIWWMSATFIQRTVAHAWSKTHPGKAEPSWISTFKKFYIRKEPHGDNALKTDRYNSWVGHIGFVYSKPKNSRTSAVDEVRKIVSFVYSAMFGFAQSPGSGSFALGFMEHNDDQAKLYRYLTTNKDGSLLHDLTKREQEFQDNMRSYFKKIPSIDDGYHLDYFFTDFDIKCVLENFLGANS